MAHCFGLLYGFAFVCFVTFFQLRIEGECLPKNHSKQHCRVGMNYLSR